MAPVGPGGGDASASLLVVTIFSICLLLAPRICIADVPAEPLESSVTDH